MYTASRLGKAGVRGLTLVEMIIFIVIISIAVTGVLLVMNNTTAHSGDAQLRKQAIAIAEGLLEEVEMARYTYCDPSDANLYTAKSATVGPTGCNAAATVEDFGPESGNVRPFDNVNDYVPNAADANGRHTTTFAQITDINGNQVNNLTGQGQFSATVSISKASLQGMQPDSGASSSVGSALLITVVVNYGNGQSIQLDGYRTQYAPNLPP